MQVELNTFYKRAETATHILPSASCLFVTEMKIIFIIDVLSHTSAIGNL